MILHLSSIGCRVESAQNATMALEKLMDAKLANQPFDTIFIDMEMPDLDGKEFARRILKDPHLKEAHLILMTYTGKRLDKTTLSSLGFTAQIAKPVYRNQVLECLMDIHNISPDPRPVKTRFGIEEPKAVADQLPGHFHILLAEDNKMNQKVAVNMLQKLGHTVTIAEDGKKAVEKFLEKEFDLLLMDGQMPVLDGLEATRAIREYEKKSSRSKKHIPIVALTANAMKGDRERFIESGMDDYITKPIKRKDLEDAILRCMSRPKDLEFPTAKGDIIHLDELLQAMNGDKQLVKECFDDFHDHYSPMLSDIRSGIDKNDTARVKASLLTFRDSVKQLSCKRIMDAAFALDRAFDHQNKAMIEKEFNTLYDACAELKDFIIRYSVKNLFMKFLIVDDEFVSRKKAHKILSQYGECDVAVNGLEALNAYVRAHNENDPYNLIFLDINMPDLNGNQVMEKIRQWERAKGVALSDAVKIIMMSADGSKETVKAALKKGCEAFLVKPVTRDKLAQAFRQVHYI
jgi:CheY-like chemotaxis protein